MAVRHIPWPVGTVLLLAYPVLPGPGTEKALVKAGI